MQYVCGLLSVGVALIALAFALEMRNLHGNVKQLVLVVWDATGNLHQPTATLTYGQRSKHRLIVRPLVAGLYIVGIGLASLIAAVAI